MATAEQLKSLIRSHLSNDSELFYAIVLQVAAYEARQGHGALAHEIRKIIEASRLDKENEKNFGVPNELSGMVYSERTETGFSTLVLPDSLKDRIRRIIHEHQQKDELKRHGLFNRRKILLAGPPGTGKTLTASVLAHELSLPLHTIQVDKLVTKFMGETSAKLRQIFELIRQFPGVFLFDEFDALGGDRSLDNDVGEMRRVLNSLLQFIEQDNSDSVIVAATNKPELLDRALFRRFDDILYFEMPDPASRLQIIRNVLGLFVGKARWINTAVDASAGLSHAEIDMACRDAVKNAILRKEKRITSSDLLESIGVRKQTLHK